MGIPVDRVKIICFMLCSVLAGFAGMIQVLRLDSPLPSIGVGMELQAVAAAVIGGTALDRRHRHRARRASSARSSSASSTTAWCSRHVDANWFQFAIGVLTIFAVIANAWLRAHGPPHQDAGGAMNAADHRVSRPA